MGLNAEIAAGNRQKRSILDVWQIPEYATELDVFWEISQVFQLYIFGKFQSVPGKASVAESFLKWVKDLHPETLGIYQFFSLFEPLPPRAYQKVVLK